MALRSGEERRTGILGEEAEGGSSWKNTCTFLAELSMGACLWTITRRNRAPMRSILSPDPLPSLALMRAQETVIRVDQMAAHSNTSLIMGLALSLVNAPRQAGETEAQIKAVTCQEVAELGFHQCCLSN